ncbi:hypothetical protein BDV93DRAFT_78917 [Ceratobasidium sp. AG-I]|nr:hypothetical protein BDV93DRAFT_78917 [Ceratobasidium sp. AG-I]
MTFNGASLISYLMTPNIILISICVWVDVLGHLRLPHLPRVHCPPYYPLFPWYFAAKTIFVVWLQLPQVKGAAACYYAAIRPWVGRAHVSYHPLPCYRIYSRCSYSCWA